MDAVQCLSLCHPFIISGFGEPPQFSPLRNLHPYQGLSTLSRLTILDVSSNRIVRVEGLEGQEGKLEDLWLNDNQVGL